MYKEYIENKDQIASSYKDAMKMRLNNYEKNLNQNGNVFDDGQTANNTEDNDDFSETRSVLYQKENKRTRDRLKR